MENPVGKDVAALEIGGELDFVDRQEPDIDIGGHGLDRAHPEPWLGGNDLLLACHEGGRMVARLEPHPIVNLARQEPQGEADHTAALGEHALDGEVRLASIGRAENGRYGTSGGHGEDYSRLT